MKKEYKIEYLKQIGEAMYGAHWKTALSEQLGVADRTLRRWATGESEIPDKAIRGLLSFMNDRALAIQKRAASLAYEMRAFNKDYERIIYLPDKSWILREDLNVKAREWFDIDGLLYATHPEGQVIDVNGNDTELPKRVTLKMLQQAKDKLLSDPEYGILGE